MIDSDARPRRARRPWPSASDLACLTWQLARGNEVHLWPVRRVAARCPWGFPAVAENLPYDATGRPFPTLFYLTCPTAVAAVGRIEAGGGVARFEQMLAPAKRIAQPLAAGRDAAEAGRLAASLKAAERYERRRRRLLARETAEGLARPVDGGASLRLGIGGVARRGSLKCLHCHAAHALVRPAYVLGRRVLAEAAAGGGLWCDDARCGIVCGEVPGRARLASPAAASTWAKVTASLAATGLPAIAAAEPTQRGPRSR
jgi:hypothetical protein